MNEPACIKSDTGQHHAANRTLELIRACWSTQVIHAAVRLGVPDAMGNRAVASAELAQTCRTLPHTMFRLLRALAALGLCRDLGDEKFALTPEGHVLCASAPGSLRSVALHWGGRAWDALGHLEEIVRTGVAWKHAGRDGFYSMAERPAEAATFNRAMATQTMAVAREIVAAFDFSRFRSVVDVGGGYGALLAEILKAHPQMRGATADLPHIEAEAMEYLSASGIADRAHFVATDFFEHVQPGAQCYVLKFILHDWNDADSIEILRNTGAAAAASDGRVLIVERIAPERVQSAESHLAVIRGDIQMMASNGGMERTLQQYGALIAAARLTLAAVVHSQSEFSVLECRPVVT